MMDEPPLGVPSPTAPSLPGEGAVSPSAPAPYDFGEAIRRVADLTVRISTFGELAAATHTLDERTLLADARDAAHRQLTATTAEINTRLHALVSGGSGSR